MKDEDFELDALIRIREENPNLQNFPGGSNPNVFPPKNVTQFTYKMIKIRRMIEERLNPIPVSPQTTRTSRKRKRGEWKSNKESAEGEQHLADRDGI